jgi:hypothetical protein
VRGEAAIDWQSHAEHEARPGAAEPEDGRGDLIGPPQSSDRLIAHDLLHRVGLLLKHVRNHGRIDRSGAHRIDANAPRRIFKRGALGQAVARRTCMSRKYYRMPEEAATTNFSWSLAIVLAVSIGLPLAGTLLLLFG